MKVLLLFSISVSVTKVDDLQIYSKILFSPGKLINGCSADMFTNNHCVEDQVQVFPFLFFAIWVFSKLLSVSRNAVVKTTDPESSFGRQTNVVLQN